eukprot:6850140-Pyramimonas_sp.AAC.1
MGPRSVCGVCRHGCGGRMRTQPFWPSVKLLMGPRARAATSALSIIPVRPYLGVGTRRKPALVVTVTLS